MNEVMLQLSFDIGLRKSFTNIIGDGGIATDNRKTALYHLFLGKKLNNR